jgi:uncharacterized membrane protein YphA (DoxX/SURF4 family)
MHLAYDTTTSSARREDSGAAWFRSPAPLRIGAGVLLMTTHGWSNAVGAWLFLWEEQPWVWVTYLAETSTPLPHLVAPVLAILIFAVALSWVLGFFTRLFSALLVALAAALLVSAPGSLVSVETAWLYLLIAGNLTLFGSGNLSLDRLLGARSSVGARRGRKGHRY